ncbi:MAG: type II toxin-antitoxin system RelE/ParE family toxin [bacterium]|nr:type II toxin-antitoxin system RelE/ParE family toxin [bacterium]
MSDRCVLSDKAQRDLREIWWYVFQFEGSDRRADTAIDKLYSTFGRLADSPNIGKSRGWLEPEQLAFPSGAYLVVYWMTPDGIEIARVSGADGDLRLNH